MLKQRGRVSPGLAALVGVICSVSPGLGQEGLRRVHVGDTMPEFSLTDARGTAFRYEHKQARVLGILILQAGQTHLQRLVTDMEVLLQKLRLEAPGFDCVGVMSGSGTSEFLRSREPDAGNSLPIVADPNFAFWGKLGVIATPTAIVVGTDHKVRWIKAGFGYDFVAGFHSQLNEALGLGGGGGATVHVQTLENTSVPSRRDRHIQLARRSRRRRGTNRPLASWRKRASSIRMRSMLRWSWARSCAGPERTKRL